MRYEFNIKVSVDVNGLGVPLGDKFPEWVNKVLHTWEDGRYEYGVELLRDSLEKIMRRAIYEQIDKITSLQYGNERVQINEESYLRSYLETKKICEKLFVSIFDCLAEGSTT